ncbi:MAG TPA: hypothetical protein VN767_21035 [Streptosporangiaceae bacterium]|jgi:hypothetical protein|nr:hypothetical protein [Streptosporangiaceae bacterium]
MTSVNLTGSDEMTEPIQGAGPPGSSIRMVSIDELKPAAARSAQLPAPAAQTDTDTERWRDILVGFIDDPRGSVAEAAELVEADVSALIALLSRRLSRRREAIAQTWQLDASSDPGAVTENLRLALRDYREFSRQIAASRKALS